MADALTFTPPVVTAPGLRPLVVFSRQLADSSRTSGASTTPATVGGDMQLTLAKGVYHVFIVLRMVRAGGFKLHLRLSAPAIYPVKTCWVTREDGSTPFLDKQIDQNTLSPVVNTSTSLGTFPTTRDMYASILLETLTTTTLQPAYSVDDAALEDVTLKAGSSMLAYKIA